MYRHYIEKRAQTLNRRSLTPSLWRNGAQIQGPLKHLDSIVLCDVRGVSGSVLNWAPMMAERRQSLGRFTLKFFHTGDA